MQKIKRYSIWAPISQVAPHFQLKFPKFTHKINTLPNMTPKFLMAILLPEMNIQNEHVTSKFPNAIPNLRQSLESNKIYTLPNLANFSPKGLVLLPKWSRRRALMEQVFLVNWSINWFISGN